MSECIPYQNPNFGLLFYKHVYKEPAITQLLDVNENYELTIKMSANKDVGPPFDKFYNNLLQAVAGNFQQIELPTANCFFTLFTTYPGLIIGSGYQHDTKAMGDFKTGFFFDHVTGQPVIPGSSVKGLLRHVFELDVTAKGIACTGEKSVAAIKFICEELIEHLALGGYAQEQEKWGVLKNNLNIDLVAALKIEIFGGSEDKVMGSDVFFDGVINVDATGANKLIFSKDFITPHSHPFKNPVPIQILKVLPNTAFNFSFKLNDSGEWTKDRKALLFKQILLTFGAGAKTNVGYGQFVPNVSF